MNKNITITEWSQPNFRAINKFYRSQKHKGSASGDERVFCMFTQSTPNEIIAAVRLVPQHDYYWLRSLYIEQSFRRHSLGSQLLDYVHTHITQPIYCFPYEHLLEFYQTNSYTKIEVSGLPEPLKHLFLRYSNKGQKIISMAKK